MIQTPNLDALAGDGDAASTHAFCTTASCSASRSVILTGLHNHANGQYGHQHNYHKFNSYANAASLPVYLSNAGYRTARCGKYHVAPEPVYQFDQVIPGNTPQAAWRWPNNCRELIEADERPAVLPLLLHFRSAPGRGHGRSSCRTGPTASAIRAGQRAIPASKRSSTIPADVIVPGFLPDTPTCRAEIAQYYQSVSRDRPGLGPADRRSCKEAGAVGRHAVDLHLRSRHRHAGRQDDGLRRRHALALHRAQSVRRATRASRPTR